MFLVKLLRGFKKNRKKSRENYKFCEKEGEICENLQKSCKIQENIEKKEETVIKNDNNTIILLDEPSSIMNISANIQKNNENSIKTSKKPAFLLKKHSVEIKNPEKSRHLQKNQRKTVSIEPLKVVFLEKSCKKLGKLEKIARKPRETEKNATVFEKIDTILAEKAVYKRSVLRKLFKNKTISAKEPANNNNNSSLDCYFEEKSLKFMEFNESCSMKNLNVSVLNEVFLRNSLFFY